MKTKEELNELKAEVEALNRKLAELTEEELVQVVGGIERPYYDIFTEKNDDSIFEYHFYSIK